ncbi:MAG: hypothetical protein WDN03_04355 [Rhizomicrobium sp.]
MRLVLLHSPLVGPSTWQGVAARLAVRGHHVALPDLSAVMRGSGPFYAALAELAAAAITDTSVLVVHSGAGALVPAIAVMAPVAGAVFVDALLPHPGESWFSGVPEPLGQRLRGLAKAGRLPPWHAWWPKGAIEAMLPDGAVAAAFLREQAELPLVYFEERAPDIALATPSAYLQLSGAYEADADAAEAADWPVARLNLHHLAMLTDPGLVAVQIEGLATKL